MDTIFFAWQSKHLPTNAKFIETALEQALKQLGEFAAIEFAERQEEDSNDSVDEESYEETPPISMELDTANKDTAGAVNIMKNIYEKIRQARIFVGDVSLVCGEKKRAVPNPNVLVELGYAIGAWNTGGNILPYIMVLNTTYGDIKSLPFDISQLNTIKYNLPETATEEQRDEQFDKLVDAFVRHIGNIYHKLPPVLHPFIQQALVTFDQPDRAKRNEAIEQLIGLIPTEPDAYSALLAKLNHISPEVRQSIALALVEKDIITDQVLQVLAEALSNPNAQVKGRAEHFLGKLGSSVIPVLQPKLLKNDIDTQRQVVRIFGRIGNASVGPQLVEMLGRGNDQELEKDIINALGDLKEISAIDKLIEYIEGHNRLYNDAVNALIKIGYPAVSKLCNLLLVSEDTWVIQQFTKVLEEVGDSRAICYLVNLWFSQQSVSDTNIKLSAEHALVIIGNIIYNEIIVRNSFKESETIIYPHGKEEAIEQLLEILDQLGPQQMARVACIRALGIIQGNLSEDTLIGIISEEESFQVHLFTIAILGTVGGDKSRQILAHINNTTSEKIVKEITEKALEAINERINPK